MKAFYGWVKTVVLMLKTWFNWSFCLLVVPLVGFIKTTGLLMISEVIEINQFAQVHLSILKKE